MGVEDNWKHKSEMMLCKTCMWFILKGERTVMGRCRRRAPTLNGWPVVFRSDWCGDHKIVSIPVAESESNP
ncbi:MAG: hypothetical protein ACYSW3_29760 [Planctomycetota bacterium]|jgi:hypothetical protein